MLHQIGAGTLGPVFRAYDSTRERLVAVKLFKLDLPPECGHQLVAEFERLIAAHLTDPGLAAPLATGISGVSAFLAQDYVAADSLDLAIRERGPAPAADALRVAAQLAAALDAAAAVDVTHGALHPRDILLSSDVARLTGLGVTRALARIGVVAPVRRPYTAPERLAGGEWDRRADVFSLAALMHELMWARRVSGLGVEAAGGLTEIAGADLPALRAIFSRALAENPAERYETAVEFAVALTQACADAAPASASAPKRRAVRQHEPRLPLDEEEVLAKAAELQTNSAQPEATVAEPDAHTSDRETNAGEPETDVAEPEKNVPDIVRDPAPDAVSEAAPYEPSMAIPAGLMIDRDPEAPSALERSRSAIWPLVLALFVGIAIGFGGGYAVGSHEQPGTPTATAAVAAPAPAGREFTEGSVAQPPKPTPPAASPAPVPKPAASNLQSEISNLKSPRAPERQVVRPRPRAPASRAAGTPAPARRLTGALAVDSRPSGARVYLDGKLVGRTPLSLASVSAAPHAIRLERDGYRRWSSSVRVVAGEQNRVTASLER